MNSGLVFVFSHNGSTRNTDLFKESDAGGHSVQGLISNQISHVSDASVVLQPVFIIGLSNFNFCLHVGNNYIVPSGIQR